MKCQSVTQSTVKPRIAKITVAVLIAMVASFFAATNPAQALGINTCLDAAHDAVPSVATWPGSKQGGSPDVESLIGTPEYGATGFEWLGTGGLTFTSVAYDPDDQPTTAGEIPYLCDASNLVFRTASSVGMNLPWQFITWTGSFVLWAQEEAQTVQILPKFYDTITQANNPNDSKNMTETGGLGELYTLGMFIAVIAGGLWVAWKLVIRRRTKEGLGGLAWMIGAIGVSGLVLINPILIPQQVGTVFSTVGSVAGEVGAGMLTWLGNDNTTEADLCTLAPGVGDSKYTRADGSVIPTPTRGSRQLTCSLWKSMLYDNWRTGQFGDAAVYALDTPDLAGKEYTNAANGKEFAFTIPGLAVQPSPADLPLQQASALTLNVAEQRYLTAIRDGAGTDYAAGESAANMAKSNIVGRPDCPTCVYPAGEIASTTGISTTASITHQQRWDFVKQRVIAASGQTYVNWSGADASGAGQRASATWFAGISVIGVGLPIAFQSIALIWYQIILGILFIFLAIPLAIGIHPGAGRKIAIDYLATMVGYLYKTVVTLLMIAFTGGIVTALPSVFFPTSNGASLGAVFATVVAAVASLVLWRKFIKGSKNITFAGSKSDRFDVGQKVGGLGKGLGTIGTVAAIGAATGGASLAVQGAAVAGTRQLARNSGVSEDVSSAVIMGGNRVMAGKGEGRRQTPAVTAPKNVNTPVDVNNNTDSMASVNKSREAQNIERESTSVRPRLSEPNETEAVITPRVPREQHAGHSFAPTTSGILVPDNSNKASTARPVTRTTPQETAPAARRTGPNTSPRPVTAPVAPLTPNAPDGAAPAPRNIARDIAAGNTKREAQKRTVANTGTGTAQKGIVPPPRRPPREPQIPAVITENSPTIDNVNLSENTEKRP
jgi:hypothetical protein